MAEGQARLQLVTQLAANQTAYATQTAGRVANLNLAQAQLRAGLATSTADAWASVPQSSTVAATWSSFSTTQKELRFRAAEASGQALWFQQMVTSYPAYVNGMADAAGDENVALTQAQLAQDLAQFDASAAYEDATRPLYRAYDSALRAADKQWARQQRQEEKTRSHVQESEQKTYDIAYATAVKTNAVAEATADRAYYVDLYGEVTGGVTSAQHEAALTQADLAFAESTGNADIAWTTQVAAAGKTKKTTLAAHEKTYKLAVANAQKNLSQGLAYADEAETLSIVPSQTGYWTADTQAAGNRNVAEMQANIGFRSADFVGQSDAMTLIASEIATPWTADQSALAAARVAWWNGSAGPIQVDQVQVEVAADATYETAVDVAYSQWATDTAAARRVLDLAAAQLAFTLASSKAESLRQARLTLASAEEALQEDFANQRKTNSRELTRLSHSLPLAPYTTASNPADPAWGAYLAGADAATREHLVVGYRTTEANVLATQAIDLANSEMEDATNYRVEMAAFAVATTQATSGYEIAEGILHQSRSNAIAQANGNAYVASAATWNNAVSVVAQQTISPWSWLDSQLSQANYAFAASVGPAQVNQMSAEYQATQDLLSAVAVASRNRTAVEFLENADQNLISAQGKLEQALGSAAELAATGTGSVVVPLIPAGIAATVVAADPSDFSSLATPTLLHPGPLDREPFKTASPLAQNPVLSVRDPMGISVKDTLLKGVVRGTPNDAPVTPTAAPAVPATPAVAQPIDEAAPRQQRPLPSDLKAAVKEKIERWLDHGFTPEEAKEFKAGFEQAIQDTIDGYTEFVRAGLDYGALAADLIMYGAAKSFPGKLGEDIRTRVERANRRLTEAATAIGEGIKSMPNPREIPRLLEEASTKAYMVIDLLSAVGGSANQAFKLGGRLATFDRNSSAMKSQLKHLLVRALDQLPNEMLDIVSNTFANPYAQGYTAGTVFVFLVEETVTTAVTWGANKIWTATNMTLRLTKLGEKLASFAKRIDNVIDSAVSAGRVRVVEPGVTVVSSAERARLNDVIAAAKKSRNIKADEVRNLEKELLSQIEGPSIVLNGNNCFAAETPLLTPDGDRPIQEFRVGDLILTRDESDPEGPLETRTIEAVFERSGETVELLAGGQCIRTTLEHPFFVVGKGWVSTEHLAPGDQLLSHDGQSITVEGVNLTHQFETLYNIRVTDCHTYFVGRRTWGFGIWAHNAYSVRTQGGVLGVYDDTTLKFYTHDPVTGLKFDEITAVEAAREWTLVAPGNAGKRPTNPSMSKGGVPTGKETKINYKDPDTKNIISSLGERLAADELAQAGYKVERNPAGTTADLKVEGLTFDVKTPQGSGVSSFVKNQIEAKIYQAEGRFVVNLHHSKFTAAELIEYLNKNVVPGLKEIIFIHPNGSISHFVP